MYPHLRKAPIVEAVIDLQVSDIGVPTKRLKVDVEGYPRVDEIRGYEIGVNMDEDGSISHQDRSHVHGYRYAKDGYLLQFRRNGYTLSKLEPYDRWETFEEEARKHWKLFKQVAETDVSQVTRIAVRYINKLLVPESDRLHIQSYLKNAPETPDEDEFPFVDHFFSRMVIPLGEDIRAIVISTMEDTRIEKDNRVVPFVLDIDVFKDVSENDLNEELVWGTLGQMRDHKNKIFFSVMSEKAIGLCQ